MSTSVKKKKKKKTKKRNCVGCGGFGWKRVTTYTDRFGAPEIEYRDCPKRCVTWKEKKKESRDYHRKERRCMKCSHDYAYCEKWRRCSRGTARERARTRQQEGEGR